MAASGELGKAVALLVQLRHPLAPWQTMCSAKVDRLPDELLWQIFYTPSSSGENSGPEAFQPGYPWRELWRALFASGEKFQSHPCALDPKLCTGILSPGTQFLIRHSRNGSCTGNPLLSSR